MKAVIYEQKIRYGENRYLIDKNGNWKFYMRGLASGQWVDIDPESVPESVKKGIKAS